MNITGMLHGARHAAVEQQVVQFGQRGLPAGLHDGGGVFLGKFGLGSRPFCLQVGGNVLPFYQFGLQSICFCLPLFFYAKRKPHQFLVFIGQRFAFAGGGLALLIRPVNRIG